jgi:hypothetical protein
MISWRLTQQRFFKEPVEFKQDQRIKNFFSKTVREPTFSYGDVSYFKEINFSNSCKKYNQCLLIFNHLIETSLLVDTIKNFKYEKFNDNSKICICINKFLIYSNIGDKNVENDYDQALYNLISNIFVESKIKYYFVKNLKGDHFNFASPTSQFFFNYKLIL